MLTPNPAMSAQPNKYWLLALGAALLITRAAATEPASSPLLQTLEKLECAPDAKAARSVLNKLFNISPPGQEWPDEWMGTKPENPALYAGTLDIALSTLSSTAQRFPTLREESERVVLQWNYCDVLEDQRFQNLRLKNNSLQKIAAADDAPLKWDGFRHWGFLSPDPKDRLVPLLLAEIRLAPEAYHLFLHRVYRQHCFPHPESGLRVSEEDAPREPLAPHSITGEIQEVQTAEPAPYPFLWKPSCRIAQQKPIKKPTLQVAAAHPSEQQSVTTNETPKKPAKSAVKKMAQKAETSSKTNRINKQAASPAPIQHIEPPPPQTAAEITLSKPGTPVIPAPTKHSDASAEGAKGDAGSATKPEISLEERGKLPSPPPGRAILPTIAQTAPDRAIPMFYEEEELETQEQAHNTTGIINEPGKGENKGKKKKLRLAGSISDTLSLKDGSNSFSASATLSPAPNWFASGNVSVRNGELGYSWSAGYADWEPGTWSAQINNWGPLKPGEGLAIDKAVTNIGYQFKSNTLEKHKMAASGNLSIPVNGKPSVSGTVQWSPKHNWYGRATASVPLDGGKPNWNYGFGYTDPRPGKWRVEYSNYGQNDFLGDNPGDGSIIISRGWQF
ncbi:MAG: hypothetical protein R3E93_02440 [Thiothrix sp.]